jgi:hypothetical protein
VVTLQRDDFAIARRLLCSLDPAQAAQLRVAATIVILAARRGH